MNVEQPPRLHVNHLTKDYLLDNGEARKVIDDISLTVNAGEFISIIGPSGCGKSTLFNMIAGLELPTSGTIDVDGRPLETNDHTHVAYMPQKDLLFPWRTITENAALGLEVKGVSRHQARQQVKDLFPQFGLDGFEDSYPFELSGGMRQRAALLRTVALRRDIMLLDEPFGALDSLTRLEMHTWLQHIWNQHSWTALLITHDVREAITLSDRVVVLAPRPTKTLFTITVDLPRPRELEVTTTPEFTYIEKQILNELHAKSDRPPRISDNKT